MSERTLAQIAAESGLVLHGNGDLVIDGVGTLESALPGQLGFLANPKYRAQLAHPGSPSAPGASRGRRPSLARRSL